MITCNSFLNINFFLFFFLFFLKNLVATDLITAILKYELPPERPTRLLSKKWNLQVRQTHAQKEREREGKRAIKKESRENTLIIWELNRNNHRWVLLGLTIQRKKIMGLMRTEQEQETKTLKFSPIEKHCSPSFTGQSMLPRKTGRVTAVAYLTKTIKQINRTKT